MAYYHCVSRVVDRQFIFDTGEKQSFLRLMRAYEKFCQVRVVTYCLMSNHFHLLVEVPKRPEVRPSEAWLMAHIEVCYGDKVSAFVAEQVKQYREAGAHAAAELVIEGWFARMWDVSQFMKTLKQRFTQWYNKHHERRGTLWEARFRSTIVEGGPAALGIVAAYVDLNPVRAGLVNDPKDYPWCGYSAAVVGETLAQDGIGLIATLLERRALKVTEVLARYRRMLFVAADGGDDLSMQLRKEAGAQKAGIHHDEVEKVHEAEGKLTLGELLRCRVRYFTAGAAIGTRDFVNAIFDSDRGRYGRHRIEGARPMRGGDFLGLCSLRDLQKRVIEPSGMAIAT
ncbi:MAG: transposase [Verrucomicrobium sp.]